jgi:hypothetical protein
MTNPVTGIKEARMNIQQFQDVLDAGNSDTPAHTRFSAFKDWYYDPVLDAFGPGKFIGYQGTTVSNYKGNGAGKETKRALAAFFVPLDKRSALYTRLFEKLVRLSKLLGHEIGQKFHTTGGIFVPKDYLAPVWNCDGGFDERDEDKQGIAGRTDIGETAKRQLVMARRGQGKFKDNVTLNETRCRITGIGDLQHLRASHIKPWKRCNDTERLHGCNGLLLAPHIDHLFDRGFISFKDNGDLLVSKRLDASVLAAWGILFPKNCGKFKPDQKVFLRHHREWFLKRQITI